ncbi:interstitial collagenase [Aedes albopictus]|uniref:Peptidase metallopeptidase domain-containing protein n=1 Tax=Aedes albopictus TaxID=7160 RepID=A0ABM1ZN63_AEDAL|nr:interstitial collagenase-like [Aedes albopictus]
MAVKQCNIRGDTWRCCLLAMLLLGEAIQQNEASLAFPNIREGMKLKFGSKIQEPSTSDSNSSDTSVALVVPLEEPVMSEDDAEKILDDIRFYTTNDNTDDNGLRFFAGANTRILRYQQQFGLKETGELDRETKISLQSPTCGVSNVAAFGEDKKWSSRYLTYYVRNTPWGIPSRTVKNLIRNAFDQWSKVTNLEFAESNDPKSDMEISFGGRRHTNRESKCQDDLGNNTLAHAFYPPIGGIHFNTKFFSGTMNKDLFLTTAIHEIGHSIGLEHSFSKASVMYPNFVTHFSEVPKQDVENIQMKYGKRQNQTTTRIPTFCDLTKYDAMLYYQNTLAIIAGKYCYTKFNGRDKPTLLSEMWPGAPETLDAAESIGLHTFLFKGEQVWVFKDARLQVGYPRKIHEAFPGLPKNLDGIFYDKQTHMYAFKMDHYWRYNTEKKNVDHTDGIEEYGLPGRIDAAILENVQKRIFFFKDSVRYIYDLKTRNTTRHDDPMFC